MFYNGQQFGHYTLVKQLGKGGFGEVWLAHNQTDASTSPVAIKFPKSEAVHWQAIVQEIGLWVLCGKHPNVLPLVEARKYDGQIVIISEYARDGSLRDLLKKQGALSMKEAVEIIIGVLDGLAHLHSGGIIHRDLKPENILLQGNAPRLADFGISRVITVNEYSNTIIGTPSYMSPESFSGKRTVQTDVWGIGVILYELLEGKLPFPQKMRQELHEAIANRQPEPLCQAIPPKLQEIVLKALSKQPEARYQTAAEMCQGLRSYWHSQETISTIEQIIPVVQSERDSIKLQAEEQERYLAELGSVRSKLEEEVARRTEQEQYIKAEILELSKAEEEQRLRIEAEIRRRTEAIARLQKLEARAEEETQKSPEQLRLKAEAQAHRRAELEAQLKEEEARLQAERDAHLKAEEEARRLAEDTRLQAEAEANRHLEAEAR